MFHRLVEPVPTQSFFLFGARGTGKSTFLSRDFPEAEAYCFSQDPARQRVEHVTALPWQDGLTALFS